MTVTSNGSTANFSAEIDGVPGVLGVGRQGLDAAGRMLGWVAMDSVAVRSRAVVITMFDEPTVTVSMLGPRFDAFIANLTAARSQARRAALLQWTGTPEIATFAQSPASADGAPIGIHVFAHGITVEPQTGTPELVPYALVRELRRDGYRITFARRGLDDVVIGRLGPRTDEFWAAIHGCMAAETDAMAAAFADLDDRLAGFSAPNGWAVAAEQAGAFGGALARAFAAGDRGTELAHLASLASGGMRYGVSLQPSGPMPFVLATGRSTTAVESVRDDEARATYLFSTTDTDALGRALVQLSFRREAIHLPTAELGRWSLAARTLPVVRWARSVFAARVIHDGGWAAAVTAALR